MRVFLTIVIPLLLPTALWFLYVYFARRRAVGPEGQAAPDIPMPWVWLAVVGGVLAVATFFLLAQLDDAPAGSHYEPAELIDGQIRPGRFD